MHAVRCDRLFSASTTSLPAPACPRPKTCMRGRRLNYSLFWRAALQRIAAYNNLSGLNAIRVINPDLPNITRQKDAQVSSGCNLLQGMHARHLMHACSPCS